MNHSPGDEPTRRSTATGDSGRDAQSQHEPASTSSLPGRSSPPSTTTTTTTTPPDAVTAATAISSTPTPADHSAAAPASPSAHASPPRPHNGGDGDARGQPHPGGGDETGGDLRPSSSEQPHADDTALSTANDREATELAVVARRSTATTTTTSTATTDASGTVAQMALADAASEVTTARDESCRQRRYRLTRQRVGWWDVVTRWWRRQAINEDIFCACVGRLT
ncbi:uncharacterized protein LTHEOB_11639 [Neofusicoccum parvum]|uniref:Uncharacterized protein LTHEOB_11639 n=1 Tax=Neofusicoccum parvum TaxID=310453 RepID=A0ACB5RPN0_9PEZI|nr:uncharacterized protein LTHEOB_11639 [Neofusicoccum parvum]